MTSARAPRNRGAKVASPDDTPEVDERRKLAIEAADSAREERKARREAERLAHVEALRRREYVTVELGVDITKARSENIRAQRQGKHERRIEDWNSQFRAASKKARIAASLVRRERQTSLKAEREQMRAELKRARLERLMRAAPGASSSHRGVKSTHSVTESGAVRREPDAAPERLTDGKRHPVTVRRFDA